MKVLLLDADGVVLKKGEFFSEKFSREYSVPIETVMPFFKNVYGECQAGTKDLKEELIPYLEEWGWESDVEAFLECWFEDTVLNPDIKEFLRSAREERIACYLASNNEHYRARHIERVLGDALDGYFFSADLKVKKSDPAFFQTVLSVLGQQPEEAVFIDNEQKNLDSAASLGIKTFLYSDELFRKFDFTV